MQTLTDAPTLLREELNRRIAKNSKYSLRAFAKALGLSPATLSLMIARKTPLSRKALSKISKKLNLTPAEIGHLESQIRARKTLSPDRGETGYKYVALEIFKVISQWYYYAILSLLELKDSSIDPRYISKKLRISVFEAEEAVDRLKRLELVAQVKGKWKQTSLPLRIDEISTNSAARSFQTQLLNKAIESLENDPVEHRDFTSVTFAMNKNNIHEAIKRITEFRRSLSEELELIGHPDSVYNLTIQLFPVTKEFTK